MLHSILYRTASSIATSVCVTVMILSLASCQKTPEAKPTGRWVELPKIEVTVSFDFRGRGENYSREVSIGKRQTVYDALKVAIRDSFGQRGTGGTLFITHISGVANEGADGDNWIYRVNGELGTTGCEFAKLEAGDHVEWVFGKYP